MGAYFLSNLYGKFKRQKLHLFTRAGHLFESYSKLKLDKSAYSKQCTGGKPNTCMFVHSFPHSSSQLDVVVVHKKGSVGSHKDFKDIDVLMCCMHCCASVDHDVLARMPPV